MTEKAETSAASLLEILDRTGVRSQGHFLLTSGRHSPYFFQFSQLFQHPSEAEGVARRLAAAIRERGWLAETVCGPAMGGVLLGYELARAMGCRAIYTEKTESGMALRRGFQVAPGEPVVVVEDAVTTGGSLRKSLSALVAAGARPVGVAALVDRSGGKTSFEFPFLSLVTLDIPDYDAGDCPLCRQGLPLTAPKGSPAG